MQASTNVSQSAWGERSSSSKATVPSRGVQKLWAGNGKQGILLNSLLCNAELELSTQKTSVLNVTLVLAKS